MGGACSMCVGEEEKKPPPQFDAVPLAPATKAEVTKSEVVKSEVTKSEVTKSEVEDDTISNAMEDDPDEEDDEENDGDDDEDFEMVDGLFVDRSFDACRESIGGVKGDSANPEQQAKMLRKLENMVEGWARPSQLMGSNSKGIYRLKGYDDVEPCLFGHTSPMDLKQGGLGDCWLMSAMSAIAEFPFLVHRLFKQQTLSEDGRYDIRLYDVENEEWDVVTIDDRLPFSKKPGYWGRLLMCTPTKEGEFWPCLLEKAFAKYLDGYFRLDGGFISVALIALTGKPSIAMRIQEDPEGHYPYCYVMGPDWGGAAAATVAMRNPGHDNDWGYYKKKSLAAPALEAAEEEVGDELEDSDLFAKLMEWDEKGYIMGASSRCSYNGVIGGHAYALLQLLEVETEASGMLQMLKIRNPHAGNEWTGPFSDADEESWGAHPEAMEACGHEVGTKEDGEFWMTLEEFKKGFKTVAINFQRCVDQDGNKMAHFNEIEEGHEYTDFELDVEGHEWKDDDDDDDGGNDDESEDDDDDEEKEEEEDPPAPEVLKVQKYKRLLRNADPTDEKRAAYMRRCRYYQRRVMVSVPMVRPMVSVPMVMAM